MEVHKDIKAYYAKDRQAWREWLREHHATEKSVWLILYYKKSDTPSVYYEEAVEEALCFGWIDSKGNKRDNESSYLFFARRNPKSKWSKINKERVEKLESLGWMEAPGKTMVETAKKNGAWTALEEVDNLVFPQDLVEAFERNTKAKLNFEAFAPTSKRIILEWILNAKRPETRLKRIAEAVSLAEQNKKANHIAKDKYD